MIGLEFILRTVPGRPGIYCGDKQYYVVYVNIKNGVISLMVCNCADETLCSRLRNPSTQHRHFLKFVTSSWGRVSPGGFGFLVAAPIGQP